MTNLCWKITRTGHNCVKDAGHKGQCSRTFPRSAK